MLILIGFLLAIVELAGAQEKAKPAVTPYWGFGHWIWEDQIHTSNTVRYLVDGYSKYDIPVDTVILDSPWSSAYNNFEWDATLYPDFEAMLQQLHAQDIRVILWYSGFVNKRSREVPLQQSPLFDPAVSQNYTVNDGGLSWWHKGEGAHIDFTNKAAVEWWHRQVDKVLKLGIDGWKVDISSAWLGDDISTSIGPLPNEEFRPYYYKDAFEYARSVNPDFMCYTYGHVLALQQEFDLAPVEYSQGQWSGDFTGNFAGIAEQLTAIYKSAKSGYGAPACEIGGYWGEPSDKKSFIRYTQMASMVPLMVNGGNQGAVGFHLPWNYDEETISIYRDFVNLHKRFAPYLFSNSVEGHLHGGSIVKECSIERKSHRLGSDLFVQAITTDSDTVAIVFPQEGRWIDYWNTADVFSPASSATKEYPINRYPIFIRAGAIIPFESSDDEVVELMIYPCGESRFVYHKPAGPGVDYTDIVITLDEGTGLLEITSPEETEFRIKVVSFQNPTSVSGADRFEYDSETSELLIEKTGRAIQIEIEGLLGYSSK